MNSKIDSSLKRKLFVLLTCLSAMLAQAQTPDWVWYFGTSGAGDCFVTSSTTNMYGITYVCGYYTGPTLSIGGYQFNNHGGEDIFLAAFSGVGSVSWARSFGSAGDDRANSIEYDGLNLLVVGSFSESMNWEGVFPITSAGNTDAFIATFDSFSGNCIWATSIGGTGYESAGSIDGNYTEFVVSGTYQNSSISFGPSYTTSLSASGSSNGFLVKYSAQSFSWVNRLECTSNMSTRLLCRISPNDGSIILTGSFTGTITFDGNYPISNNGPDDCFLSKYGSNGNTLWVIEFATDWDYSSVGDCAIDAVDGIYVSGGRSNGPDMDGTLFIYKFDAAGSMQWDLASSYLNCGIFAGALDVDATGNCYFTARHCDQFQMDNLIIEGSGVTVVAIDPMGIPTWTRTLHGYPSYDAEISLDLWSNIYVTGSFSGSLSDGNSTLSSNGWDIFVGKLCAVPLIDTSAVISGPIDLCEGVPATFTIEPEVGVEFYAWSLPDGWQGSSESNSIVAIPNNQGGSVSVARGNSCMTDVSELFVNAQPQPDFVYSVSDMVVNFSMLDPVCISSGEGFTWDYGNGTQNTLAPNPTWTYSDPGSYSACLNCAYSGCTACAIVTVPGNYVGSSNEWVGMNESRNTPGFSCHPNPATDLLFFSGLSSAAGPFSISIADDLGRCIRTTRMLRPDGGVDVADLPNGSYILSIETSSGILRQAFELIH